MLNKVLIKIARSTSCRPPCILYREREFIGRENKKAVLSQR